MKKRLFLLAVILAAVPVLAAGPLLAGTSESGVTSVPPPDPNGNLEGTWFYQDPGFQIAIFIWRDGAGTIRMKYHLLDKASGEFETDDGGYAKYIDNGDLIEVLFTGSLADPHRIKGYHERTRTTKTSVIKQTGDFELYLAEKGEKLVL